VNPAVRFLHALAQALSAVGLYAPSHPARQGALDELMEALETILEEQVTATYTILPDNVVFGAQPLREMKGWSLATRLIEGGIERLELKTGVEREEMALFLEDLNTRLTSQRRAADPDPDRFEHIRFGTAAMLGGLDQGLLFDLQEEGRLAAALFESAQTGGRVSGRTAGGVLEMLAAAMGEGEGMRIPQIPQEEGSGYVALRSMNTSILARAFALWLGLTPGEVRDIAEAALLYDIGKVTLPAGLLDKPGRLTEPEWALVRGHPVEGARILVRSGPSFDLAAVAAYEHHLDLDGSGYPELLYPRSPHRIGQLVRLCDTFDAMRTRRAYEEVQPIERIAAVMREGAGRKFASDLVRAFAQMLLTWTDRFVEADAGELSA
jgi:HD-GYP domain-containing protein (c-di-GMP phosphodiesterase class II)